MNTVIDVTGATGRPSEGIWAEDRNGVLRLVALEGGLLEVAPGDLRMVETLGMLLGSSYGDGGPVAFNDSGQLAFRARFTDGTAGVFVSDLATIPEPCSLSLLMAAITVSYCVRREP